MRLLKLPARVRARVVSAELSEGHARALLGAGDAAAIEQLAERVVRGGLSVRATEALVRTHGEARAPAARTPKKSPSVRDLEQRLARALGTKVEVRDRGNKGEVVIPYADLDALDRLIDKLLPNARRRATGPSGNAVFERPARRQKRDDRASGAGKAQ